MSEMNEQYKDWPQECDGAMLGLISFYMTGAVFNRSQKLAEECLRKGLELQTQMLKVQLTRALKSASPLSQADHADTR